MLKTNMFLLQHYRCAFLGVSKDQDTKDMMLEKTCDRRIRKVCLFVFVILTFLTSLQAVLAATLPPPTLVSPGSGSPPGVEYFNHDTNIPVAGSIGGRWVCALYQQIQWFWL